VENLRLSLALLSDDCVPRRMVLKDSTWRPQGAREVVASRAIVRRGSTPVRALPQATSAKGSWPSFRGPHASGVRMDRTSRTTGTARPARTSCGARPSRGLRIQAPLSGAIGSS
jgi:hypothetical protein